MKTNKPTISKHAIECYKIRVNGEYADISIDANQSIEGGRISIASSYGSWEHYWGSPGTSFKKFLIGLSEDYAAGKFGQGRHFDFDKTLKNLKTTIEEYNDDAEVKNKALEEYKSIKKNCSDNINDLYGHILNESPNIREIDSDQPHLYHGISPSFHRFWQLFWPIFVEGLKSEFKDEPKLESC